MSQDLVTKALIALKNKDFEGALVAITGYGKIHKFELQHYLIKGLSESTLSRWPMAEETFDEATQQFPHQAPLWLNLGLAQENNGKLKAAIKSLEHCLTLNPKQADAHGNLSNLYRKSGRFQEAEAMARLAYENGAAKGDSLNSLGLALGKQGKYKEAEKAFQQALSLDPNNALYLSNLANLSVDQLHFDDAWKFFAAARQSQDTAVIRRDEGMAHLLAADYNTGWDLYNARLELQGALRLYPSCPRYAGEDLSGKKLLLLAEQGLGDTIMFCRYGQSFSERGAELIWAVQESLKDLLAGQVPGSVHAETEKLPKTDYYLPLLSCPFALQKFQPSEAPKAPYLKASVDSGLFLPNRGKKRIGLVWSGSSTHERDHERSLSLHALEPILNNVEGDYYALSKGTGVSDIGSWPITNLSPRIRNFTDTAAFTKQMDFIVSVDTSVAHLAGALGVMTYIFLPYCPDWRWGIRGENTPWYRDVILLRQTSYGDWSGPIETLLSKLKQNA